MMINEIEGLGKENDIRQCFGRRGISETSCILLYNILTYLLSF